nr:sigma 54-interacting transcriptional regulator [uncultured Oscillibacter sp.]
MEYIYGLDFQTFFSIVDNMYDEVMVYDKNYNIVYVNRACSRHYGCPPEHMIGKSFYDFVHTDWWQPSILPIIFRDRRSYAIRQSTYLGSELLTIAAPLFNAQNEIEFVVMNVRDDVNELDLYNPQYLDPIRTQHEPSMKPVAKSLEMREVLRQVERVAQSDATCLFRGEVGVGKTVTAQYLYSLSRRRSQPMAVFNCTGMPDERMQRELFGSDKTPGLLYRMRNGTLLLENISELSLHMQTLLLKYLSDRESSPKESTQTVRLLAATDKDLKVLIRSGQFLDGLYYLLSVADIYIPPLRKRKQDIRPLIHHFLGRFCPEHHVNRHFTEGAIQALIHTEWHDNVRELQHTIERLVVMTDSPVIDTDQLPKRIFGIVDMDEGLPSTENESFDTRVEKFEAALIHDAYQKCGTSRKVAEYLGLSQTRANNLIRKYVKSKPAD